MPKSDLIAAIDLGGTNMQIGLVNPAGKVVRHKRKKTNAARGFDAIIESIEKGVRSLAKNADLEPTDLHSLAIGAPGASDPEAGVVFNAVNLGWTDVPLVDILQKRLGLRVTLDNDVNCAIVGEHRCGAGRGAQDILGVWVGTGVGGGLILGGKLHHGHFMTAGEIGHMTLFPGAMPASTSLEDSCSRTAVVTQIIRLIKTNHPSALTDMAKGDFSRVRSSLVAKAYAQGDPLVQSVVDHSARLLGTVVAGCVTLLSLERVVLGGGLTEAMGSLYADRVAESVREHVFPDRLKKVSVVATELADDAGVVGAACLARDRFG